MQIHIWLDENYLKVQLLSPVILPEKYHVFEKHHYFIEAKGVWFRSNEIWRETRFRGQKVKEEKLYENFAPVMYEVKESELRERGIGVVRG